VLERGWRMSTAILRSSRKYPRRTTAAGSRQKATGNE
jgi:hypothetical protein